MKLNLNSYVIPTPAWLLAPFPIGTRNRRQVDGSLGGILNMGLRYNLPGALAHRNQFYDLAGGDKKRGGYKYPNLLLDATLAVLRRDTSYNIFLAAQASLQILSTKGASTSSSRRRTSGKRCGPDRPECGMIAAAA